MAFIKEKKDHLLNVRTTKQLAKEFKIACLLDDRKQADVITEMITNYINEVMRKN